MLLVAASLIWTAPGGAAAGPVYSAGQLARIVDPKPPLPWGLERGQPYLFPVPAHDPAFTLKEWLGEKPPADKRAIAVKLQKAGFTDGRHLVWNGKNGAHPAGAIVFAYRFRTVAGAEAGLRALRPSVARPSTGLGVPSWTLTDDQGTAIFWRRGNLAIYAGVGCDSKCGFPPLPAARAYVGQIDGRAKRLA
jgi:hypothetical protein